ncbi:MAG: patatin-like phospholipase family protein [Myxococcales bacterium]|jgi:hypothetical protein|nr:patatin-like phospholipase family protein [Myxococcales bacterium]
MSKLPAPQLLHNIHTLEQCEVGLVRARLTAPAHLDELTVRALREVACLAKLHVISAPKGEEIDVQELTAPLREETLKLFSVVGLTRRDFLDVAFDKLRTITAILRPIARLAWNRLKAALGARLPLQALQREVHQKSFVLTLGGGGGSGHIYLGALDLLARRGLTPALLSGTSVGALYGLFRARQTVWSTEESLAILRAFSFQQLFGVPAIDPTFGLPAAVRLCLRESVAPFFSADPDAPSIPLSAFAVPIVFAASGIRAGALPRPLRDYARMVRGIDPTNPASVARAIPGVIGAFIELFQISERIDPIYFGLDRGTEHMDAIDAAGFSAALPGALQYDVPSQSRGRHAAMVDLVKARELLRLCDGALVDNVPARGAFLAVQSGKIRTRNACILALDCFAPRLTSPFLAMQSLVLQQVNRSVGFAHCTHAFRRPPNPLDMFPNERALQNALRRGAHELESKLPLVLALMAPLDPVETRD